MHLCPTMQHSRNLERRVLNLHFERTYRGLLFRESIFGTMDSKFSRSCMIGSCLSTWRRGKLRVRRGLLQGQRRRLAQLCVLTCSRSAGSQQGLTPKSQTQAVLINGPRRYCIHLQMATEHKTQSWHHTQLAEQLRDADGKEGHA